MKKLVFVAVGVGLIVLSVKYFKHLDQTAFVETSQRRVTKMFENMESGRVAELGDAIGFWYVGHPIALQEDVVRRFEHFLEAKKIPKKISSWEIVATRLIGGDDVVSRYVEFDCRVDDKMVTMRIPHKLPMYWAD